MIGDRIESASEDEDFWEKRLENINGMPTVKRHGMLWNNAPTEDRKIMP